MPKAAADTAGMLAAQALTAEPTPPCPGSLFGWATLNAEISS